MNNKYFGLYRGIVTDNDDPAGLMRIRIRVPSVLGDLTPFAEPCVPPGVHSVPDVGTGVWIEFESGDPDFPGCFITVGSSQ